LLEQRIVHGNAYEALRVNVDYVPNIAVLSFGYRGWDRRYGELVEQSVSLTWTQCALGGRRPWFRCPTCCRRVALLYSSGGLFGCRHCYGLAYASQNENPWLRNIRRTRKIRRRLGGGFSFAEPLPKKPRGMHWKTYLRLRAAAGEPYPIGDLLAALRQNGRS
jgi:hypothetical protein